MMISSACSVNPLKSFEPVLEKRCVYCIPFHVPFLNCSHYYITLTQTPPLAPSFQAPTQTPAQPPPSPPPHILGQIVEMGFSVAQARKALSTTKDGMDVQAALENLLNGGSAGSGSEERERESRPPPPQRRVPPPAHDEPPPATQRAAPKGYKERERERMRMQRGENTNDPVSITEIQLQADKLVSQASEIGLSVFSKATAFLEGRAESVVTAYEEHVPRGVWVRVARGGQVDEEDLRVRLEIVVSMMVARVLSRRNLLRTSNPTSALQQPLRVLCSRTRITAIL